MEKIRFIYDYDTEPLPCEHFDIICGTSTGGCAYSRTPNDSSYFTVTNFRRIIALMLGRLRMSVGECIEAYLEMSKRVFGQPNNFAHREKFDPAALEGAIQDIVERKLGDKNAALMDSTCCKTWVKCSFL